MKLSSQQSPMIQQTLSVESFMPGHPADYIINIVVSS